MSRMVIRAPPRLLMEREQAGSKETITLGDVDRSVTTARGAAKRAAALTHRLLAFSRRQTLDPKPTNVNRLVAGMQELIERTTGPEVAAEPVAGVGLWATLVDPGQIDLLVMDVGLPGGMNGRQVAEAARVARPGLKVLFITGYAENVVLSHGHLDPAMHVVAKPFAMEMLVSRIKELIGNS